LPAFVHLQVVQHDYYTTRAEDNRISLVPIVPNRGVIVDRHGTVLARNYSAFTLEITPSKVDDLDATIEGLGKVIEVLPKDRKRFASCWRRARPSKACRFVPA
jgi:penicillin-binding protein 2